MKRFYFILLLFSTMFFAVSCSGSEDDELDTEANTSVGALNGECYPNKTCNDGFVCDPEKNICIEESEEPLDNSDKADSDESEDSDTASEANAGVGELNGECYPNKTCNDGFVCDPEKNICIEEPENPVDDETTDDETDDDEVEVETDDDDVVGAVVDPCEPNICPEAEHSDGVCTPSTEHAEGFYCGCVSDLLGEYLWYDGKCRQVVSRHRCEQLAQLAEETFPIPDWASTALEFVCHCFSDTCVVTWEP